MSKRELERHIKRRIREHYGWDLGTFRDDVNYNEGIAPFVQSLVQVLSGGPQSEAGLPIARIDNNDREAWARIRSIRENKGMSVSEAAAKMQVHADFLSALEDGRLVSLVPHVLAGLEALGLSTEDRVRFFDWLMDFGREKVAPSASVSAFEGTRKQRVEAVIDYYFAENLWLFRPEFSYEESIKPFVHSMLGLAGWFEHRSRDYQVRLRKAGASDAPPFGFKWQEEDGKKIAVPDEKTAPIVREAFRAYLEGEVSL